jgi:phosphatidylglycerol:prolipoprotein diacylglycerol transferase
MTREGFPIGPLFVHWYGVIIMLGAVGAAYLAERLLKRKNMDPEMIWDSLPWILVAGILGARIWHILTPPDSMVAVGLDTMWYLRNPLEMLKIWNGGLGIPGAVIGGVVAMWIYTRRHKVKFGVFADVIAPGLAMAQAVGRWGNFLNQELYGAPSDLPWAIYIDPLHRISGYADVAYYHPLFLYESIWNLLNMALLLWLGKKFAEKLLSGDIFLVYLIVYPIGRFLLEYLRLDASSVGLINANQTLMGVVAVVSAGFLIWRHTRKPVEPVVEAIETQEETTENSMDMA